MFESLSDRLSSAFRSLSGRAQLTEENIRDGLREVRLALLEADVNFKVVKQFVKDVEERAVGQDVMNGLNPGQMVIKIVNEEMVRLMGSETAEITLQPGKAVTVIMMTGLQGAGKTTTAAKLAGKFKIKGRKVLLTACDVYRPAAIKQLQVNGEKQGVDAVIQCFFLSLFFAFFQDLFLADGTVFQGSHIVKQVKVLENHSYLGTILRDIYIFTGNVCSMIVYLTAGGCFQHIQAAKQSGFTGTGGSDNTGYITSAYREVDVAQNLITSKGFSQML